jgi:hypothetical protein
LCSQGLSRPLGHKGSEGGFIPTLQRRPRQINVYLCVLHYLKISLTQECVVVGCLLIDVVAQTIDANDLVALRAVLSACGCFRAPGCSAPVSSVSSMMCPGADDGILCNEAGKIVNMCEISRRTRKHLLGLNTFLVTSIMLACSVVLLLQKSDYLLIWEHCKFKLPPASSHVLLT